LGFGPLRAIPKQLEIQIGNVVFKKHPEASMRFALMRIDVTHKGNSRLARKWLEYEIS
jgi:hypothetical protein